MVETLLPKTGAGIVVGNLIMKNGKLDPDDFSHICALPIDAARVMHLLSIPELSAREVEYVSTVRLT